MFKVHLKWLFLCGRGVKLKVLLTQFISGVYMHLYVEGVAKKT